MSSAVTGATDDRYVSALEVLADRDSGREVIVEIIPELFSSTWRLLSYEVLRVRRKFGRLLVFCRISYRDGANGCTRTSELVAKIYKIDRGAGALHALRQLRAAGFCAPGRYRVPRPYGYSPEHHALVQERVFGTPWADLLGGTEREISAASERAADWLVRLQGSAVVAGDEEPIVALTEHVAREIAAYHPQYASSLENLSERLAWSLSSGGALPVPSHGDYHPENILLSSGSTSVIDFDHLGRREPAFDVGYAIGQLLIMSYLRTGGFSPGVRAALAFWRRYESAGPAGWSRVAVHAARTFLQSLHYELCVLKNDRVELIPVWTDLIEEFLGSKGPETLEDLIRNS